MKYKRGIFYLLHLISPYNILFFFLVLIFFNLFNLIFQYFRMDKEFGNLDVLLFGNTGFLFGAFNGFTLIFYILPLVGVVYFIEKWTTTSTFLLYSRRNRRVLMSRLISTAILLLFYLLLIIVSFLITFTIVRYFVVDVDTTTSWKLTITFRMFLVKYVQFITIAHGFLIILLYVKNRYIILFLLLALFIYSLVEQPPWLTPLFLIDRSQILVNSFSFFIFIGKLIILNVIIFSIGSLIQNMKKIKEHYGY
ncbi:hypothetical protein [Lactococcus allomyrinae]|uniref:Uncharacterized protein n=1 Tax=Lactococcus allomyrinae TaxID=2419773 RepID=A0A387BBH5_9LACT|nr:hypothetical protein [Lactococcus allomyrinae]AYG01123.1 hypothetical protein D7I46_08470 [Lactococcus allomyrinae]